MQALFLSLMITFASLPTSAQGPRGEFMCRRYDSYSSQGSVTNVATMYLHRDGSYQAKDLTTSIPEVHGHFTYNPHKKNIEWNSGIWKTLLGHYNPSPSGTPFFVVTTKKDPEGKVDGTFQCIRVSR
jgi:hypothetical protein